jgi:nucleotide-binding universal stress UspA family protein
MPTLKKILIAYDGSAHSKEALNWGIDLSLMSGAEIVAIKVFDGGAALYSSVAEASGAILQETLDELLREDRALLEGAVAEGQSKGVMITGEILQGNVAGEIISYAKINNVDLIIAGTRGHGALAELLMGSVTRNLVSLAHIPVLVVKD